MAADAEHRDIRSASLPFKRDKDHDTKWSMGIRPLSGIRQDYFTGELSGGSEAQRSKWRPRKQWSYEPKTHATASSNATMISINDVYDDFSGHVGRKVDANGSSKDHVGTSLSRSVLELLPQHANNKNTAIRTTSGDDFAIPGILYSFDTKGSSPNDSGRQVDLGGLVEQAERKWKSEQTEKIIKGEYEVLDNDGETTFLSKSRGKKGSPKNQAPVVVNDVLEDDGFELI